AGRRRADRGRPLAAARLAAIGGRHRAERPAGLRLAAPPAGPDVVHRAHHRRGSHRDRLRPQQPDRGPLIMRTTHLRVPASALAAVVAIATALGACWSDDRPIQWDRPRTILGPIPLTTQVAYVDSARD